MSTVCSLAQKCLKNLSYVIVWFYLGTPEGIKLISLVISQKNCYIWSFSNMLLWSTQVLWHFAQLNHVNTRENPKFFRIFVWVINIEFWKDFIALLHISVNDNQASSQYLKCRNKVHFWSLLLEHILGAFLTVNRSSTKCPDLDLYVFKGEYGKPSSHHENGRTLFCLLQF